MFAYHHGKNCTDSDSIDNNVNSTVDKSITLSTLQPTNLSQFSTKSIVDHEKHITTTSVDFETVSNRENMPFQRSYSEIREPILCPFCNCDCEPVDCEVHQIFCLENPKKVDRLYHDDQSTDTALIRCELCRKSIEWQLFEEHINSCVEQEHKRRHQQSRTIYQDNNNRLGRRKSCNEERFVNFLSLHENLDAEQDRERRFIHQDNNNGIGQCKYCNAERSVDVLSAHEDLCQKYRNAFVNRS
ncbi:unnamed protein product [Rotaria sordida]|uniref:Uncharacterized protein n=1 Tax=Rotaria sordida TaxID=392033 RepID=A0A815E5A6_9BILA|nr:unnamed protein product [Rotaria sordida]CAF1577315.1 unnamed protein product [Rotaria sordida]